MWGPSLMAHRAVLRRGRMGQQQLLLGGEGLRVRPGETGGGGSGIVVALP